MKKLPKTIDVLNEYKKGGILNLINYFNDENLEEPKETTFVYNIKKYIEEKSYNSVATILEDILLKFNNYDKKDKTEC